MATIQTTLADMASTVSMDSATTALPESLWKESNMVWTVVVGFVMAFFLAFAVGANDVANSFGTTVGAKVLTMKSACILASIFETAGAVLIGAKVGETIRKGIIDVNVYNQTENGLELLMMGEVSAMCGSAIFQLVATWCSVPVSGTHSIVGACIGFSLVAIGSRGIQWGKLGLVISSWFISPITSGIMSVLLYVFITKYILEKEKPLENGLRSLPFFYAFTIGVNIFSILFSGAPLLGTELPLYLIFVTTFGIMVTVGIIIHLFLVPNLRKKVENSENDEEKSLPRQSSITSDGDVKKFQNNREEKFLSQRDENLNGTSLAETLPGITEHLLDEDQDSLLNLASSESNSSKRSSLYSKEEDKVQITPEDLDSDDPPEVDQMFSFLQILTACFGSFAHGGNDVSNAIGPLIALWLIFRAGTVTQQAATPWYLLVYGGAGMVIGLWILGRRVIETIGKDLTKVTTSRGFSIELMTAVTVLIASNIGVPISTTHCKVGSVISIGWYRSRDAVKWSMVRNIALAWFITVPVSGIISALCMFILMRVYT